MEEASTLLSQEDTKGDFHVAIDDRIRFYHK